MRSRILISTLIVLATLVLLAIAASPALSGNDCWPESPYLFCGYDCRSDSCVKDIYVTEDQWCYLTFPSCAEGYNHACCKSGGLF